MKDVKPSSSANRFGAMGNGYEASQSFINASTHKQKEEKLKASEIRYRRLFEAAKDGVLILDANNGQIIDVNPYLTDLLGYSHQELLGRELWEIGVFKNIVSSKNAFQELKNKEYIHFENMPLETKKGTPIAVEFVSNVYMVDHSKVIQCNVRNITERKLEEEKSAKYQKQLIELNATKDKLLSIIAHDLRSPFTSILGFSELLIENIRTFGPENSEEFVAHISSTAQHTLILLDNLLLWSRNQTGEIDFKPNNLLLGPIIQEIVGLLNSSAILKNITLNNSVPEDTIAYADPNMLKTILRNLVQNSIKFTKSGGTVDIHAVLKQNQIVFSITDSGVGMTKETYNNLFRIDTTTITNGTEHERGSGLGLVLCKEFVEKNGGKIWAESEVGKGCKFEFTIPSSI